MKITDAKSIPVHLLVEKLGGRYSHTDSKREIWYFSPFRPDERTASFKINKDNTIWHDFGMSSTFAHQKQGSGGDIVDLWCDYHFKDRRLGIPDALKALGQFINWTPVKIEHHGYQEKVKPEASEPRFKILGISEYITFSGLKDELDRRKISLKVARLHLKQGHILDTVTNKKYNGFLFENDKGGYEISIPNPTRKECFKTCIGPKASTRILVSDEVDSADIFEGFWDMLSWFEYRNMSIPRNHTYVLNSTSLVSETCEKIIHFKDNIGYVFLFMDHDEAGYQATHSIAGQLENENIKVGSCEQIYSGFKDFNEFWMTNFRFQQ